MRHPCQPHRLLPHVVDLWHVAPGDQRGWVEYAARMKTALPIRELEAKAIMDEDACTSYSDSASWWSPTIT